MCLPDLNTSQRIEDFVCAFYQRIFADEVLAPIFNEHIKDPMDEHLSVVGLYWKKLLLGDQQYKNKTMQIHHRLHAQQQFEERHYRRWLTHFEETAAASYAGPCKERAIMLARKIVGNMNNLFS